MFLSKHFINGSKNSTFWYSVYFPFASDSIHWGRHFLKSRCITWICHKHDCLQHKYEPFIIKPDYCHRAMSLVTGVAHVGGRFSILQLIIREHVVQDSTACVSRLRKFLLVHYAETSLRHNVRWYCLVPCNPLVRVKDLLIYSLLYSCILLQLITSDNCYMFRWRMRKGKNETKLKGRSGKCTLHSILDNFRRLGHDSAILGFNHLDDDVLLALGRGAVAKATTITSRITARVTTRVAAVGTASTLHREGGVARYRDANKQTNK